MSEKSFDTIRENTDPLLDSQQAADFLSLRNPKTLNVWRCRGAHPELQPTFIGRSVRYKKSILEKFIAERTRRAATPKQRRGSTANA